MKEKDKWIDEALDSIAAFGKVEPTSEFSARMLERIEQRSWMKAGPKPRRLLSAIAAAIFILALFNGFTLLKKISPKVTSQTDTSVDAFVYEYGLEASSYLTLNELK